jgi:toluene monooxygenase system protein E
MSPAMPDRPRATLKTYSHLGGERRMPTEYELTTSRLLYYVARGGFEVEVPLADWYARWQRGSKITASDWERFADPRETTYARYVKLASEREAYVDGLFAAMDEAEYARGLATGWNDVVTGALFPLRYALHGLQMAAAYVGHMAPSGRIAIACAMQAADEVRRIQRIAYRMALARRERPEVEAEARAAWETGAAWQPLREVVETLLTTWDWGEAFVALDLAIAPWLDALVFGAFARRARVGGDALLAAALRSLGDDGKWHREWARALVEVADGEGSAAAISGLSAAWRPRAERAVRALAPAFDVDPGEMARDAAAALAETGVP